MIPKECKRLAVSSPASLPLYHLLQHDKKPSKSFVSQVHIDLNKEFIIAALPSPEGKLVQRPKYNPAPEVLEEPVIAECEKRIDVNSM